MGCQINKFIVLLFKKIEIMDIYYNIFEFFCIIKKVFYVDFYLCYVIIGIFV